jgi:TRAP-type C4-dicarboxylate transport system permease large subunit
MVVAVIMIIYVLLGTAMEELSMILLTVPVFFPIVAGLDFGMGPEATAVWFGILVVIVVEVGLITPPVGINAYVINSMAKDVPLSQTFIGILPFLMSDFCRIALILLIPATCTWLPGLK